MNQFVSLGSSYKNASSRLGCRLGIFAIGGVAAFVVACGGAADDGSASPATVDPSGADSTVVTAPEPTPTETSIATPTNEPDATSPSDDAATEPTSTPRPELLFDDDVERSRAERLRSIWGWKTDLNERTIPLTELEIVLPKDRIVPIDEPTFAAVAEAPDYMDPQEPVVALIIDGDARAYPLAMLMWHEIVNDSVGGAPVTVTFCPLCNTGITFSRIVDGEELTFGTSGMLRKSNLVMWDRQTESFWWQVTGAALVGDYAADETVLTQFPSSIMAWETFAESYPDGKLLERIVNEYGSFAKPYDNPPYAGYDNINDQPFLFRDTLDDRLVATSRVLTIDGEIPVAYPFSFLEENPVLNDIVNDSEIVALFDNGTFSAFNDLRNERQTSGSVAVFSRNVGEQLLTFEASEDGIIDVETQSSWNFAGIAIDGELAGTQLEPVVHANHFWFSWAVFKPTTEIRNSLDDIGA